MVEKEIIEQYLRLGLEKGHCLSSLKKALVNQGADGDLVEEVADSLRPDRDEVELNMPSYKQKSNFLNAVGERFNKHPYLYVLLIFFILSAFLVRPVLWNFNSSVVGGNDWGGDHCQALWNIWWVPYSLFTLHKGFYYTDYLFYPIGASLTYHWLSIANTMIFLPFRLFFGVETIFNLIVFCSFFLSAFSMFLLVYYLTKNRSAAFIAGMIYGFCPWRYIHFMHINLLSMQYMPLATLFILKIYEKPNKRDAVFGAIFLFLNALSCWYYMQFFFMFFGIYVVFFAVKLRKNKEKLVTVGYMTGF